MVVIPLDDDLKHKFPVVTLCLILLSCFVFVGFQLNENEGYDDALAFSHASGLLRIESLVYKEFLKTNNRELPVEFKDDQKSDAFFWHMMQDDKFQYELRDHALITPSDPGYAKWSELRQVFESDLDRVFTRNNGYSPARHNYSALFTAMFVHSSFWHLLVNMVLLWFVGSLLEIGSGRLCLAGYGVAGFGGTFLFGLIFPIAQGPLAGSSAAIAGLIGTYAVLYSRSTLRAFHTFQFPVDYPNIPGWFLLPVWGLIEVVQIVLSVGGRGAYVSHILGLLLGLGFGTLCLSMKSDGRTLKIPETKSDSKVDSLLEKVEWELSVKRRGEARKTVLQLLKIEPDNRVALAHLFNIDKSTPDSEEFCSTASSFLGQLAKTKGSYEIEEYFEEYVGLCPTATVKPEVLLSVATSYIHSGKTEAASKFLAILLKVAPDHSGLPACLFNLAQVYRAGNKQKQAKKCLRILVSKYPETNSGRKAQEFLSPQLHHTFGNDENVA